MLTHTAHTYTRVTPLHTQTVTLINTVRFHHCQTVPPTILPPHPARQPSRPHTHTHPGQHTHSIAASTHSRASHHTNTPKGSGPVPQDASHGCCQLLKGLKRSIMTAATLLLLAACARPCCQFKQVCPLHGQAVQLAAALAGSNEAAAGVAAAVGSRRRCRCCAAAAVAACCGHLAECQGLGHKVCVTG